ELPEDVRDLWWADKAWRDRFAEDNQHLLEQVEAATEDEGWFIGPPGGEWLRLDAAGPQQQEQRLPMWRLPRRPEDCDAAATRSTWFGIVPTYSGEHSVHGSKIQAKLDDRAIYQLRCIVEQKPAPGHEHCPPKRYLSQASEPFRLAA